MGGIVRETLMLLDKVIFGLIETAYNLIYSLSGIFINNDIAKKVITNLYIVVGIFALFKIALLLINSIIDPEKLNEKGKGLSSILVRTFIMIVLLLFTPMLFQMAYDLQARVVGWEIDEKGNYVTDANGRAKVSNNGNIIEKLILGEKAATSSAAGNMKPGEQFESIALSALITVNENYGNEFKADGEYVGYKSTGKCSTQKCESAIIEWNKMYANGKMDINTLSKYIGVAEKIEICDENGENCEKEKTYVYDYTIILTTFVAGFIVYVLFSFALDIAARIFQLATLEIVSPLFIVTFIDSKSASSGSFNRWLKEVGSTYAGLFIRLACISLLLLFTSILNSLKWVENGANSFRWTKLTLLLGLLLFAKKAPKLITDMLGMKSDGMGLGIGKKIASGALGGALLAKGAKGIAGASVAGAKNLGHLAKNRREARKKLGDEYSSRKKMAAGRNRRALDFLNEKIAEGYVPNDNLVKWAKQEARKSQRADLKKAREKSDFKYGAIATAGRIGNALLNGTLSFSAAAKSDKLSGSLKVARDNSKAFKEAKGLKGDGIFKEIGDKYNVFKASLNEGMYGNSMFAMDSADDEKVRRVGKSSLRIPSSIQEKDWIGKMTQYEDATRVWDEQKNGYIYGADANERLAMIGLKWNGATDIKLDANGKISSYKDKDGNAVSVDKDEKEHKKIIKQLAIEADSKMTSYGRAQIAKFSADLGTKLVNEFGSRQADLTSIQERLSNVAATISDRTAKTFDSAFKGLQSQITGLTLDNVSVKITELRASGKNDLANQLAETIKARNIASSIGYDSNGMISYDGEKLSIDEFRSKVSSLSDGTLKNMLTSTLDFHTAAAIDYREYSDTQKRIESIMPAAAGAKLLFDFKTGLIKEKDGEYIVIDGNMSNGAKVNENKANKHLDPLKEEEKKKGNLKEGDA